MTINLDVIRRVDFVIGMRYVLCEVQPKFLLYSFPEAKAMGSWS